MGTKYSISQITMIYQITNWAKRKTSHSWHPDPV